jgi:transcriptional regulator with XRE-family HTH domain
MPPDAEMPLPGIARNLARLMEAQQVSIDYLSRNAEIPTARIMGFLDSDSEPTASDLLRLAGVLGVPPSQILEGAIWKSDGRGGGSFIEGSDEAD